MSNFMVADRWPIQPPFFSLNLRVPVAQHGLLMLVAEVRIGSRGSIGGSAVADATAADESLCLEQKLTLPSFTLHVIDVFAVFHIGVEAEDHGIFLADFCPKAAET